MKSFYCLIVVSLCCLVFSGCQLQTQVEEPPEIKILYSSIADFKRDYGFVYKKYPNITIIPFTPKLGSGMWDSGRYMRQSPIDWNWAAYKQLVDEHQPDILVFPPEFYESLIQENLLSKVTSYVNQESFNKMNSGIKDAFMELGGGEIYALSDTITAQALYYNKDIFDKYAIEYPHDSMSWKDLFQLAQLLEDHEDLISLYIPYDGQVETLLGIGKTQNLMWYNADTNETLFDSANWQEIISDYIAAYQVIGNESYAGNSTEKFLDGDIAMILSNYRMVNGIKNSGKQVNWGVVTEPVDPDDPTIRRTVNFQYMNGIASTSSHLKESIEIWSYMNSELIARMKQNIAWYDFVLPAYSSVIEDKEDHNLAAFYALTPVIDLHNTGLLRYQEAAAYQVIGQIINQGIDGALSIEQVIDQLQMEVPYEIEHALPTQ